MYCLKFKILDNNNWRKTFVSHLKFYFSCNKRNLNLNVSFVLTAISVIPLNQYITNFAVFVDSINFTGDSLSSDKLCSQYSNSGTSVPSEQPISGDCSSGPMRGRYVIIRKQGTYRPDVLVLCEVYIYGYKGVYNIMGYLDIDLVHLQHI